MKEQIINSEGRSLKVTIFRDGQILEKYIQPVLSPIEDKNGDFESIYMIGIAGGPIFYPPRETPNVLNALIFGADATVGVIIASFKGIKCIVNWHVDPKHISGPI